MIIFLLMSAVTECVLHDQASVDCHYSGVH